MQADVLKDDLDRHALTRRRLLTVGAQGALVLGGGSLLAACGGTSSTPAGGAAGTPRRGGTLTVGMITGGPAESLNPGSAFDLASLLRQAQVYDALFAVGPDLTPGVPRLAVSAESNPDATVWTLRLRDGVSWHDGKPLTADDVIYTMQRWANPASAVYGVGRLIDAKALRKRDRLTVEVPLHRAIAQFPSLVSGAEPLSIVQAGATPASFKQHPIGTGPFKFQSFTPGSHSVFSANRDYWEHGKPYVDKLVVDSSFSDETARFNALLGGSIDALSGLPSLVAKNNANSGQFNLLRARSNNANFIVMRGDKPPFNDVRVRQAMRLIADRPAIVEGAFSGFATVGSDLQGTYTEYFASDLKRSQNIEQAKSLLKAAGRQGLAVTLQTSQASPGLVATATLFAQQAKAAGVSISVQQIPAANYFSAAGGYLSRSFGFDVYGSAIDSLTQIYLNEFWTGAVFEGDTALATRATDKLLFEAVASVDRSKAQTLWREVQLQQFNEGGALVYANPDYLDGVSKRVRGLRTTGAGDFNNWRFLDGWITA